MIWGMTLHPGEEWTRNIYHQEYLTIASLECRPDKINGVANPIACLMIKTDDNEHVLCTLEKGLTNQQKLDLILEQRETVTFMVHGTGIVYLTGYTLESSNYQDDDGRGYDDMDSSIRGTPERNTPTRGRSSSPGGTRDHQPRGEATGHIGKQSNSYNATSSAVHMPGSAGREVPEHEESFTHPDGAATSQTDLTYGRLEQPCMALPGSSNLHMVSPCGTTVQSGPLSNESQLCVVADICDMSPPSGKNSNLSTPHPQPIQGVAKGNHYSSPTQPLPFPSNPHQPHHPHQRSLQSDHYAAINPPARSMVSKTNDPPATGKKAKATKVPRPRTLECKFCSKMFSEKYNLNNHLRVHTGEKPFGCAFCIKAFAVKGNLRIHERIHTGFKPFKCRFCVKAFAQVGTLRGHERTHTGERPFRCKICPRAFAVKNNLQMHERLHAEKPHRCPLCDKAFAEKGVLEEHQRKHVNMTEDRQGGLPLGLSSKEQPPDVHESPNGRAVHVPAL